MADLENVIADLDELRIFADTDVHPIVSPDNWNVYGELCDMIDKAKDDVVSLLKAQEPVEPQRQIEQHEWIVCGNCKNHLIHKWKYCPNCGHEVKWE